VLKIAYSNECECLSSTLKIAYSNECECLSSTLKIAYSNECECLSSTSVSFTVNYRHLSITVVELSCEDVFGTGDFVLPVLVVNVKNVNKPYLKNFGIKQRHLPGIHVQFKLHILLNISLFSKNEFLQLQRLNVCEKHTHKKTVAGLLRDINVSIFFLTIRKQST
jgi:hypothetical protein